MQKNEASFPSISGDGSICFSLERAKTSGRKWKGSSSCFLVAARASSVKKRTAKTRMRVSSASDEQKKSRPKDGWHFHLFLRRSSATKTANASSSTQEKIPKRWKAFPPFRVRGNGHHSLLLLRSSARKVDRVFSIHNEICPIMDSISSRSRQKIPERLLLFVKNLSQKTGCMS